MYQMMKKFIVYITSILGACLCAYAVGTAKLGWVHSNSQPVNAYRVYYGPSSGNYTNSLVVPYSTLATVPSLQEDSTYYFAVTSVLTNSNGETLESDFSNEATYKVPSSDPNQRTRPSAVQDFVVLEIK